MEKKYILIKGTILLTLTGFITRIIGFFYRIFLSHTIGAEGMGIYQLIFPISAMCFSLTVAGIQTAISRAVAWKVSLKDYHSAKDIFRIGLFLSMVLSLITAVFLYSYAPFLAIKVLGERRCTDLLKLLAFSIPFGAVHSCINGYYYGIKKANIPAFSQLLEQLVRVGASYLIYIILQEKEIAITPSIAVLGMIAGEFVSMLFSSTSILGEFQKIKLFPKKKSLYWSHAKNILTLSVPLTSNRVLLNLLQSAEAIMIPGRLKLFGLDTQEALGTYGILTGMALPFILFPSAITNSVAVMLLPTIAEAQAADNYKGISKTIENTIKYCLLLGILCTGVFITFGSRIGTLLFGEAMAGEFILILGWICPFLYLTTTLNSVLNGLGKTSTSFIHNCIGLGVRICFVIFFIPQIGIVGYLWGLLASELIMTLLHIWDLKRYTSFSFSSFQWIFLPFVGLLIGMLLLKLLEPMVHMILNIPPIWELFLSFGVLCIVYILFLTATKVLRFHFFSQFSSPRVNESTRK